jgi:hypothetical protein
MGMLLFGSLPMSIIIAFDGCHPCPRSSKKMTHYVPLEPKWQRQRPCSWLATGWTVSNSTTTNYSDYQSTTRATTKPLPDEVHWTPGRLSNETLQEIGDAHDVDKMPVAEQNGEDGKPVWMSYGVVVYNVTDFVQNHPWRQFHNSSIPHKIDSNQADWTPVPKEKRGPLPFIPCT